MQSEDPQLGTGSICTIKLHGRLVTVRVIWCSADCVSADITVVDPKEVVFWSKPWRVSASRLEPLSPLEQLAWSLED